MVSEAAENVSLTVYRAPGRGERPINKRWPQGYALITETRTISIPAGESLIRFEGVAEGMFPESAIVTGLPKGVSEKNRDARLLSPAGLVDAYLKREVTITRTSAATGKTTESQAIITTGPNGVILESKAGFEALRCTGLPERLSFDRVPEDLSAKPTLSILTQSDQPVTAKVTLTYMSGGFDWEANYLVQMRDEKGEPNAAGKPRDKASLFAWLTLANGGNQSFANANTMAIAGNPNRERRGTQARPTGAGLQLKCWPMQRTDQVPYRPGFPGPPPPPPPVPSPRMELAEADTIVVTGSRRTGRAKASLAPVAAIKAEQEDLGDLKLYRVPELVSVNAKGQKQVAMITQPDALFDRIFTANVKNFGEDGDFRPLNIMLRGKNRKKEGLGLPMPSGQVQVFENSSFGPLLAGETTLDDRAVGQKVELTVGSASDVRMAVTKVSETKKRQVWKIEMTNARDKAAAVEIEIPYQLSRRGKNIRKIDGVPTWTGTLPANGEVSFTYTVKLKR